MFDEKWLVWRCKCGSREALRQIYERHKKDVLSLALAMTGNRSLADDVLQDVFLRFTEHLPKLQLRTTLRGYFLQCTANQVRNLWKSRSQRSVPLETEPAVDKRLWPAEAAVTAETARRLRDALDSLPPEQRETIVLRLEADMPYKAIAEIQQTSIATVQSRYRYGLEKLRTLLNGRVEP